MAWWRAHDEAVDDPKLQKLPADLFRAWFNLLCLASRNDGKLPSIADVAFGLRKSEKESQRAIDLLVKATLLDVSETGIEPHNWSGRQYKSDVSTNRVRSFRKRKKERSPKRDETVSRNAPETETEVKPLQGLTLSKETSSPTAAREGLNGPAHDAIARITNARKMT